MKQKHRYRRKTKGGGIAPGEHKGWPIEEVELPTDRGGRLARYTDV